MNKQISLLFFLVVLIFILSPSVNAGGIIPPHPHPNPHPHPKDDCCCDDYPIIRDDPSKVKRGGVETPCCEPKPKQCCDCILDYCNFIPARCDKHQRILGQIQFQQFKNCSIKATGYITKAKACCENCDDVVSPPNLDVHVVEPTNYGNIHLDLDTIVTLGVPFSKWITPLVVGGTLNGFNQLTCLVAIDNSGSENSDYILGTAPVIMV